MTDPLEHIRRLAAEIGPRPATGEGERRAADYITTRLRASGYEVASESFRSVRTYGYAYITIHLLTLLGFVAAGIGEPVLGLVLSGLALFAFIGESTTVLRIASLIMPKGTSQNIVGRLAPTDVVRRRLVIAAHYDSAKSGLMFHPRMVRRFRLSFLLLALATLLEPMLCLLQALTRGHHILGTERIFWYASIIVALYVLYAVVLLVHREFAFRHVDGANDNASGVAVMLSLAESLAQQRPAATEIVMLATGCEEVGMVGMEAFIRRHREEMDRAWIINIDNVGAGEVTFITEEGMLIPWPADSQLLDVADSIVRLPGWNMEGRPFRVMSTDAQPALLRRLQAMTIIALEDGLPVNWHWETDTVENIDAETVDTAFRLGEAMAKRLVA